MGALSWLKPSWRQASLRAGSAQTHRMARMSRVSILPAALLLAAALAHAEAPAQAPAQLPPPEPGWTVIEDEPAPGKRPDAKIEHIVVEDNNARIEELRERGEVRNVTVHSKILPFVPDYEIVVGDASREPVAGPNGQHGIIGQRVWRLLDF